MDFFGWSFSSTYIVKIAPIVQHCHIILIKDKISENSHFKRNLKFKDTIFVILIIVLVIMIFSKEELLRSGII